MMKGDRIEFPVPVALINFSSEIKCKENEIVLIVATVVDHGSCKLR